MTSHRQSRCRTCSVVYTYQSSGHGCQEDLNSHEWCPDCCRIYLDAFKDVPARVKKVWLPTTDFTCQELHDRQEANAAEAKAEGRLMVRRIMAPLFDMKNPGNVNHTGCLTIEGKTYRWSWWTGKGIESGEVFIESEHDVATGDTRPWRKIT